MRLPVSVVGIVGLAIVAGHNLLDSRFWELAESLEANQWAGLWKILYFSFFAGPVTIGADGARLMVLYSIVPWVGVMALGYAFGAVVAADPARRRRLCLAIGLSAIGLFVVLRWFNLYGDPNPWGGAADDGRPAMPALFAFLNTSKYPASLMFLLMTLGPTIVLVPLLETARGAVPDGSPSSAACRSSSTSCTSR